MWNSHHYIYCLGLAHLAEPDSISVTFEIAVPESTPDDAAIFWAGSLNHWDPGNKGLGFGAKDYSQPAKFSNGIWKVIIMAPKGSEVSYKYTRGSIYSAEEAADFTYRPPRKIVFDEPKTVRDTVEAWHDIPPQSLADEWPIIELEETDINISYNKIQMDGTGTILYDEAMGSQFYNFNDVNTRVNDIPDSFYDAVYYYQKIYPNSDLQLITAAKTKPEGPWHIFVDLDGNRSITMQEKIITIKEIDNQQEWTGPVPYHRLENGKTVTDSVELTIKIATDLPQGYRSSVNPDAPDLTYKLPFKHRKGLLDGHTFYLTVPFPYSFKEYHYLTIDRNKNDTLNIGSGSNEVYYSTDPTMYRKQKFYLYSSFKLGNRFWQTANVHPAGKWIQLRPTQEVDTKQQVAKGKAAPEWKAISLEGDRLSSESLKGNMYCWISGAAGAGHALKKFRCSKKYIINLNLQTLK